MLFFPCLLAQFNSYPWMSVVILRGFYMAKIQIAWMGNLCLRQYIVGPQQSFQSGILITANCETCQCLSKCSLDFSISEISLKPIMLMDFYEIYEH